MDLQTEQSEVAGSYSFETYHNWTFFIPFVVGSLLILVSFLVLCCVLPCMAIIGNSWYDHFIEFLFMYSKIIFRRSLTVRNVDSEKKYFLNGREIAGWHIVHFLVVITVVLYCVFIVFWASFLVDESSSCDHTRDCFTKRELQSYIFPELKLNTFLGKYLIFSSQQIPPESVKNCDDIDDKVICYEFVYNISACLSAFAFLTFVVFYIGLCIALLKWLINCIELGGCLLASFVVLFMFVFSCNVILCTTLIDFELTYYNALNYFAYWFSFVYVGPVTALYVVSLSSPMEDDVINNFMVWLFLPLTTLSYLFVSLLLYGQLYVHTY
jgi:hypothetical protein